MKKLALIISLLTSVTAYSGTNCPDVVGKFKCDQLDTSIELSYDSVTNQYSFGDQDGEKYGFSLIGWDVLTNRKASCENDSLVLSIRQPNRKHTDFYNNSYVIKKTAEGISIIFKSDYLSGDFIQHKCTKI